MGVKNLKSFNSRLDKFAQGIDAKAVLFQKKVAFLVLGAYISLPGGGMAAHSGVLQLTPVDTGRAVGNWQVSIGAPATAQVGGKFGPEGGGGTNRTTAEAQASMNGVRALGGLRVGQTIWIVNNLPYIAVLNDGGTNRVAHHMVQRALSNTRSVLRASR